MTVTRREIIFYGDSQEVLREFPDDAKGNLGYQIHLVQLGKTPLNWKPVPGLGKGISGVKELRERTPDGFFRVVYVANINDKVVILHAFKKQSNSIEKNDINVIKQRYKQAIGDGD